MNLMFPKPGSTRKHKKRRHPPSIMHQKDGTCYLCMLQGNNRTYPVVHEHHVYDGPNRRISEENGFKCWLCLDHHLIGPEAVHNNIDNMRILQRECQRIYEETHTRQQFRDLVGRNYL